MTIAARRPANACLPPVVIEPVVDDPEFIRALARANGPYAGPTDLRVFQPGGQRVPSGRFWPTWSADWAVQGRPLIDGAAHLLDHEGFASAAAEICGTDRVLPMDVYVNLTTPSGGQPVSHTDIPEFRGVDRTHAPGWFRQAMGASSLFEQERITVITAVAWFFAGERGFFRYWPAGRDAESVRHEAMWNTAVVGDNNFMHHKVERTGPAGMMPPAEMTIDTLLDHDGHDWIVVEDGQILERYGDEHVRLSLSWKAKVYEEGTGADPITLGDAFARFADHFGDDFSASSTDELFSEAARGQLVARWPGFRPD